MSEAIRNYDLDKTTPPVNPALDESHATCEHLMREIGPVLTRGEDNPGKCLVEALVSAAPLCASNPAKWGGDTTPRLSVEIYLTINNPTDDERAVKKELADALAHLAKELRA